MPDPYSLSRVLDEQRVRRAVEDRIARLSYGHGQAQVPARALLASDPAVSACLDRGHYPDFWARPPRCRTCGQPYPCNDDATRELRIVTPAERRFDREEIGLLVAVVGLMVIATVLALWSPQ
jgi:hypothetical protein